LFRSFFENLPPSVILKEISPGFWISVLLERTGVNALTPNSVPFAGSTQIFSRWVMQICKCKDIAGSFIAGSFSTTLPWAALEVTVSRMTL